MTLRLLLLLLLAVPSLAQTAESYRQQAIKLSQKKAWDEAVKVGEVAIYADMEGFTTHRLFGEALAQTGNQQRAVFELESAALSQAEPLEHADVQTRLAELYAAVGRGRDAAKARKRAQELKAAAAAAPASTN